MKIFFVILFHLPLRLLSLLLDYMRFVVMVYQIALYFILDFVFRWPVSLVPSVNSWMDYLFASLKLAPLNSFPPGHYPRLQAIIQAIEQHIQNPQFDLQVINAYSEVLVTIHNQINDFPGNITANDIRHRFRDHWPLIAPLHKASCLSFDPTGICWGLTRRGQINFNRPTIWINPYLVQALEAVQAGSDICAYLQFLTIITILHEATHFLVQLVSPGTLTPPGLDRESGYQFERLILQGGTLSIEINEHDVFHLTRAQRLFIQFTYNSFGILPGYKCRQAVDRFLGGEALWIAEPQLQPQPPQPQLEFEPPQTLTLIRIEPVSNTLIRLRSSFI